MFSLRVRKVGNQKGLREGDWIEKERREFRRQGCQSRNDARSRTLFSSDTN